MTKTISAESLLTPPPHRRTMERLDGPADFLIPPLSVGGSGCVFAPAKEARLSNSRSFLMLFRR
jgi:hypothetical protein